MNAVPKVSGLSAREIEDIAASFVARVSPATISGAAPLPVQKVLEFHLTELFDIDFDVQPLGLGVEGRFDGDTLILAETVYASLCAGDPRAGFTGMHEVGHCRLHRQQLNTLRRAPNGPALHRRCDIPVYRDPEWQANAFAAAALMPRAAVNDIARRLECFGDTVIAQNVASTFKVSQTAADYRVRNLRAKGWI